MEEQNKESQKEVSRKPRENSEKKNSNKFNKNKRPSKNFKNSKDGKKEFDKKGKKPNPNRKKEGTKDKDKEPRKNARPRKDFTQKPKKEFNKDFNQKKEAPKEVVKEEPKEYKDRNVAGIIFDVTKKRYFFEVIDNKEYKKDEKVIVDTARGQELGTIYSEPRMISESKLVLPLKPIVRSATKEDKSRYKNLREESEVALLICKEKVFKHKLPMKLVGAEYTFDKSKLIFYFTTEGRVDFRELVKDLAGIFKVRIELRQIGVRDEARILGSIGICGKELCCRTFINKFDSVSIKMARDQGLVINPTKISGACGRLLCCIKYEHEQYFEALRGYPAVGQEVKTASGTGRVTSVNPLNGYLYVDISGKGVMKLGIDEIRFNKKEARKIQNSLSKEELAHKVLEKE